MTKVSAYIIAFNEAEKIAEAVDSVAWADEVLVLDSHSSDDTAKIAAEHGAEVRQLDFSGFGRLRNDAIAACQHEWVFSLDADERCTPAAAAEIRTLLAAPAADAYYVPRRNWFMGRWIGDRPLLMLSVLLIILGIQFISTGLLGEMLTSLSYKKREGGTDRELPWQRERA